MREIEFRVWDNQEKVYLNKKDIGIDNLGNIFIFEGRSDNDADLWHVRILSDSDNERYVIEQTTGLMDKNGTEICEGDIVEVKHSDWTEPTIHMVKWFGDEEYPAFDLSPGMEETMNSLALAVQSDFFSIKIIGNLHENPELLEEK